MSTSAHSFSIKLNAAESVRSWAHFASFRNCSLHEKGRAAIHHWALLLLPRANADSYLTGHAPALTPFTVMARYSRRASAVLATLPPPSSVSSHTKHPLTLQFNFLRRQTFHDIIAIKITVVRLLFTLSAQMHLYSHLRENTARVFCGAVILKDVL